MRLRISMLACAALLGTLAVGVVGQETSPGAEKPASPPATDPVTPASPETEATPQAIPEAKREEKKRPLVARRDCRIMPVVIFTPQAMYYSTRQ